MNSFDRRLYVVHADDRRARHDRDGYTGKGAGGAQLRFFDPQDMPDERFARRPDHQRLSEGNEPIEVPQNPEHHVLYAREDRGKLYVTETDSPRQRPVGIDVDVRQHRE